MYWTRIVEQADEKLKKAHEEEHSKRSDFEEEEKKLSILQGNYENTKQNLKPIEEKIAQHKSEIDVISEKYLQTQKARITVQRNIKQKMTECDTILKECKVREYIETDISVSTSNDSLYLYVGL